MTTKNSFFDQISAAVSGALKACEENRLSHECINSESEKEVENIQINDVVSPAPKLDNNYERKEEANKLTEEKTETNKKKAFKLFAGIRTTEDQTREESSKATVAYQPAVANNLYGNTGVTNQITFSPATDFRTVEEKINELYARLVMETDRNKILYIAQQIINLVPDKESFMKTLLSKLKG